jgi:hypothetical protein
MRWRAAGTHDGTMSLPSAVNPGHPERICWGCHQFCRAGDLRCGNGSERAQHPFEIFGEDWQGWGLDAPPTPRDPAVSEPTGR